MRACRCAYAKVTSLSVIVRSFISRPQQPHPSFNTNHHSSSYLLFHPLLIYSLLLFFLATLSKYAWVRLQKTCVSPHLRLTMLKATSCQNTGRRTCTRTFLELVTETFLAATAVRNQMCQHQPSYTVDLHTQQQHPQLLHQHSNAFCNPNTMARRHHAWH